MGIIARLKEALSPGGQGGVTYQCASCGEEFDAAREQCPQCGGTDVRERGSFEFRPE